MKLVVFLAQQRQRAYGAGLSARIWLVTAAAHKFSSSKVRLSSGNNTLARPAISAFWAFGSLLAGSQLIELDTKDPWTPLLWAVHALVPLEASKGSPTTLALDA